MLKTKLAYMALGAIIASFGYFIGTLNNLNADDEVARVKKLIVSEQIQVGSADGARAVYTLITPGKIKTIGGFLKGNQTWLTPGTISVFGTPIPQGVLHFEFNDLPPVGIMPSRDDPPKPYIQMARAKGKRLTLQVGDESSIKLSNGGLNSKTITVD